MPPGWHRGLQPEAQVPAGTLLGASEPWQQHPNLPLPHLALRRETCIRMLSPPRPVAVLGGVPVSSEAPAGHGAQALPGPPRPRPRGSWWNPTLCRLDALLGPSLSPAIARALLSPQPHRASGGLRRPPPPAHTGHPTVVCRGECGALSAPCPWDSAEGSRGNLLGLSRRRRDTWSGGHQDSSPRRDALQHVLCATAPGPSLSAPPGWPQ